MELGDFDSALAYRDQQILDLLAILHRWKGSVFTRHLDIAVFDRLLMERNELERHLIGANNTIYALTKRKEHLEELAARFDPAEYAAYLRTKDVQSPLPSEDRFED
jgi:hypothetical protein